MNGVYWIYTPTPMPLAVVLCPRGGRMLKRELRQLKLSGIDTLVSLLSEEQVGMLDLREEGLLAREVGMEFIAHPMPDHEIPPDLVSFRAFVEGLAQRLRAGKRIGVHCWGSIGRATMTAACTLIHLGWSPSMALDAVEAARACPVPDTPEQERWILSYRAQA